MAAIVRNLLVRAGADFSEMNKGMKNAQRSILSFKNSVSKSVGLITAALAAIGSVSFLSSAVSDAAKYDAQMRQLSETLGSAMGDFQKWQETTGIALGFSYLESASAGQMMLLQMKKISNSQEELAKNTTKMMEIVALVHAKTGMSIEESTARIRSAFNGEVDGAYEAGFDVRSAAIMQSKAWKELANGVEFGDLNEKLKATVMNAYLLEKASENLGTEISDVTSVRIGALGAVLKSMKVVLGQAFLPIIHNVLPLLTSLTNKLLETMKTVEMFMRAFFGYDPTKSIVKIGDETDKASDATKDLGNATEEYGKKAKKANKDASNLQGFDEINQLAEATSSLSDATESAGAGLSDDKKNNEEKGDPSAWQKMSDAVKAFADRVKEYLAPVGEFFKMIWDAIATYFKEKIDQISGWWKENGQMIIDAFSNIWNFIKPIIMMIVTFIWDSIKGLINGVIQFFEGLLTFIGGVFTGNWSKAWEGLKDMFFGAIKALWNFFNLYFVGEIGLALRGFLTIGSKLFPAFWNFFKKPLLETIPMVTKAFKGFIDGVILFFKNFGVWLEKFGVDFAVKFLAVFEKIKVGIKAVLLIIAEFFMRYLITPVINDFNELVNKIVEIAKLIVTGIKLVFSIIGTWFKTNVVDKIVKSFNDKVQKFKDISTSIITIIKSVFSAAPTWFKTNVTDKFHKAFVDRVASMKNTASSIWLGIKNAFTNVYTWFKDNVAGKLATAFSNSLSSIKNTVTSIWTAIKGVFSDVYSWFKTNVVGKIQSVFDTLKATFSTGIIDGVKALLNSVIKKINGSFKDIKEVSIFGVKPFDFLPTIPELAKGGIVTKPTLAMFGEAGPEAVMPLDKISGIITNAVLSAMQFNKTGNERGSVENVILNIDGKQFARIMRPYLEQESQRIGTNLVLKPIQ